MPLKKENNILDFQFKKKNNSEKLVIRSVALKEHQLEFIRKFKINLSSFVRHLLDKEIENFEKKDK